MTHQKPLLYETTCLEGRGTPVLDVLLIKRLLGIKKSKTPFALFNLTYFYILFFLRSSI